MAALQEFFQDARRTFNMGTVIALMSFGMLCYIVIQDKTPTAYVVLPFTLIVISYFVADTTIARIVAKSQGGAFQQPETQITTGTTEVSTESATINTSAA